MIAWLKLADNNRWLLVFDNVDQEFRTTDPHPLSYDIKKYIPSADHGSILITTRLTQLERLGNAQEVKKVDNEIARAILTSWHGSFYGEWEAPRLIAIDDAKVDYF